MPVTVHRPRFWVQRWVIDYEPQEGRAWALCWRRRGYVYQVSFSWLGPPYTRRAFGVNLTWNRYRL